jgi:phosphate transport system substrate-binding protein
MRTSNVRRTALIAASALTLTLSATAGTLAQDAEPTALPDFGDISGEIRLDGSSTVFPISEAVAEEFQSAYPNVRVTVAESGTGGGFEKFCAGETDANDASRTIKEEEAAACAAAAIEPVELMLAYDGISVVVNNENTWVDCLTTAELQAIWDEGSTVTSWAQVREGFPDQPIALFGPGADSGTFDYFTEKINGETDKSRSDYTQSEDDNVLVTGVEGDVNALGYFGFAYYAANMEALKIVPVDSGAGCVAPSFETIADGTYAPLSRPLYVYPSKAALARPEVAAFFTYYLATVPSLLGLDTANGQVPYIPLPAEAQAASQAALDAALAQ